MRAISLFLGLILFTSAGVASAQETKHGTLIVREFFPAVENNIRQTWRRNFFGEYEYWILRDQRAFLAKLKEQAISPLLLERLTANMTREITSEDRSEMLSFLSPMQPGESLLRLPKALKRDLPHDILKAAYGYLVETKRHPSSEQFASPIEAFRFFSRHKVSPDQLSSLLRATYEIDGKIWFFWTPDTWSHSSEELKDWVIDFYTSAGTARLGLQIDLRITTDDDLRAVARTYAGNRDPRPIERYLKRMLGQSRSGQVTLPLSRIMHPFIRRALDTHSACSGPNCFNAGISVNQGHFYRIEAINSEQLWNHTKESYRVLESNEVPRAGDLMIYETTGNNVQHVATYITPDIVFTKGGLAKYLPYVFQKRSIAEKIYFPDGQFNLKILRMKDHDTCEDQLL